VTVQRILHSRTTALDIWLTSDGRAYLAQLHEPDASPSSRSDLGTYDADDAPAAADGLFAPPPRTRRASADPAQHRPQWHGGALHAFEPPRWVQKRRRADPADGGPPSYDEPRAARAVALNGRFALAAVGCAGGAVRLAPLPTQGSAPGGNGGAGAEQVLALPAGRVGVRGTGAVCAMEWSGDGYVLAVGWERGWAVWSVGGRCLAAGFGVEDQVDEARFQDAFMHGVRGLVSRSSSDDNVHAAYDRCSSGRQETTSCLSSRSRRPIVNSLSCNFYVLLLTEFGEVDSQLFVVPFAKSAITGQHAPVRHSSVYASL
jgi:hypothetical protein